MPEGSWPAFAYNAGAVTDAEYQRVPHGPDGLVGSPAESAGAEAVYANSSGMEVHVRPDRYGAVLGRAWASGSTGLILPVAPNPSGATRIDTVVVRLDRADWLVRAAIRQGTPGAGRPALVRDTGDVGVFEDPLADVTVRSGAASIAAGDVQMRALFQASTIRAAERLADVQPYLSPGDVVYEASTGRWLGWTGSQSRVLSEDTGEISLSLYNSSIWKVYTPGLIGRKRNGIITIELNLMRVNSTLNTSSSDDSVGSQLTTLPAALRPPRMLHIPVVLSGGIVGRIRYETDGKVFLQATSVDVPAGRFVRCVHTFQAA